MTSSFKDLISDTRPIDAKNRVEPMHDSNLVKRPEAVSAKLEPEEEKRNPLPNYLDSTNLRDPNEWLSWKRDGVQPGVMQMLGSGSYEPKLSIDLHRKRIHEAHREVWELLESATAQSYRTVSINHGKGSESTPPAQMKSYVAQILPRHEDVLAFQTAPRRRGEGGAGVTLVLLRKSAASREKTRQSLGYKEDASHSYKN